jgi:hypothetical protein
LAHKRVIEHASQFWRGRRDAVFLFRTRHLAREFLYRVTRNALRLIRHRLSPPSLRLNLLDRVNRGLTEPSKINAAILSEPHDRFLSIAVKDFICD